MECLQRSVFLLGKKYSPIQNRTDLRGVLFSMWGKFFPGKYYSGSTFFPGNYYSGSNFFRGIIIYGYTGMNSFWSPYKPHILYTRV